MESDKKWFQIFHKEVKFKNLQRKEKIKLVCIPCVFIAIIIITLVLTLPKKKKESSPDNNNNDNNNDNNDCEYGEVLYCENTKYEDCYIPCDKQRGLEIDCSKGQCRCENNKAMFCDQSSNDNHKSDVCRDSSLKEYDHCLYDKNQASGVEFTKSNLKLDCDNLGDDVKNNPNCRCENGKLAICEGKKRCRNDTQELCCSTEGRGESRVEDEYIGPFSYKGTTYNCETADCGCQDRLVRCGDQQWCVDENTYQMCTTDYQGEFTCMEGEITGCSTCPEEKLKTCHQEDSEENTTKCCGNKDDICDINSECCDSERWIYTTAGNHGDESPKSCCPTGKSPNADKTECNLVCGDEICPDERFCVTHIFDNEDDYNTRLALLESLDDEDMNLNSNGDKKSISYCSTKNDCTFTNADSAIPSQVENSGTLFWYDGQNIDETILDEAGGNMDNLRTELKQGFADDQYYNLNENNQDKEFKPVGAYCYNNEIGGKNMWKIDKLVASADCDNSTTIIDNLTIPNITHVKIEDNNVYVLSTAVDISPTQTEITCPESDNDTCQACKDSDGNYQPGKIIQCPNTDCTLCPSDMSYTPYDCSTRTFTPTQNEEINQGWGDDGDPKYVLQTGEEGKYGNLTSQAVRNIGLLSETRQKTGHCSKDGTCIQTWGEETATGGIFSSKSDCEGGCKKMWECKEDCKSENDDGTPIYNWQCNKYNKSCYNDYPKCSTACLKFVDMSGNPTGINMCGVRNDGNAECRLFMLQPDPDKQDLVFIESENYDLKKVSCGNSQDNTKLVNTYFLTHKGTVVELDQYGNIIEESPSEKYPYKPPNYPDDRFVDISASTGFSGVTEQGKICCYQSLSGESSPVHDWTPLNGDDKFIKVSSNANNVCGLTSSGAIECKGSNQYNSAPSVWNTDTFVDVNSRLPDLTCGVTQSGLIKCRGNHLDLLSEATFNHSEIENCIDSPEEWTDNQSEPCFNFQETPANCAFQGIGTDGKTASEACCACEGGLGTVSWKPNNYDSGDEIFVKVSIGNSGKMVDNKLLKSVCGLTNKGTIQCINGTIPAPTQNKDFAEINSSLFYNMGLTNPVEKDGGKINFFSQDSDDTYDTIWSADKNA